MRRFVVASALLACACTPRPSPPPPPATSALLVTLDTLRADRLGAYGRAGLTPHLDALAARGTAFEGLSSVPLTLPSHATILSGLEPPRHGVHDNGTYVFPAELPTLATLLKARGFATGAFVGAYVLDRRFGLSRGFDEYDDRIARGTTTASVLESERPCEAVVDAARGWIAARRGPYFAWVHLYDAHAPYAPPSPFREAHADQPYDGEVAHVDACVGALVEAAGAGVVTVIVGDHGEALGEHGEPTHGFFLYQPTLRVPFLAAGPGIAAGEHRGGLGRTRDVLPTLLGRLGVAAPAGLDGIDLFAQPPPVEAYAETSYPATFGWAPLYAYRRGRFKRIEAPRPELYDLEADAAEARSVAGSEVQEDARLREALARFRERARDPSAAAPDAEVAERLKALGYVSSAPADSTLTDPATRTDPKDALPAFRAFEQATWADARGEHATAIRALTKLVAGEPRNPVFRRSLAASLRAAGREREAVRILEGLDAQAAGDAVAWHERAMALAAAGRVDDAVSSEQKAIALNSRLPEPFVHLGVLEAGRRRFGDALRAFEAATTLDPNNALAWNNKGNVLRALGRASEAEACYRRAAALAPHDPDPLNGLATLLVQSGRLDEAEATLRALTRDTPEFAEAHLNLAVVLLKKGRAPEARAEASVAAQAREAPPEVRERARSLLQALSE